MSKLFREQVKDRCFKKIYFLSWENVNKKMLDSNFFLFMSCKDLEFNSYFIKKVNTECKLIKNTVLTSNYNQEKFLDKYLDDFSGIFENELNSLFLQYA